MTRVAVNIVERLIYQYYYKIEDLKTLPFFKLVNGKLFFDYGWPEKNHFNKKLFEVDPKEGEMYIFPSSLTHYTEPVLGKDDYRYSISCNFIISDSVKFMTSAMEKKQ